MTDRVYEPRPVTSCTVATLTGVAWGALSFGAVYPWAYWPLLVICVVSGVLGLLGGQEGAPISRPLAIGVASLVFAVLLQLVPLPRSVTNALSPAGEAVFRSRQVGLTEPSADGGGAALATQAAHPLSIDPRATWRGLAFAVAFGLFFLGNVRGLGKLEVRRVASGVLILGVVLAFEGIVQKGTSIGKVYGLWTPYYAVSDPFGPFINRNHFAGWMVMAIPLSMAYLYARLTRSLSRVGMSWRERSNWISSPEVSQLMLVAFGILLMILSLIMTFSRSGIISFIVALLFVGTVIVRRQGTRASRILVGGLLTSVMALSFGWAGIEAVFDRFTGPDTVSLNGRQSIWQDTVRIIRDFPAVGSGFNTYATAAPFYRKPGDQLRAVEAHSDYLQLASEGGLLLVGVATGLVVLFAMEARRRLRECVDGSSDYWIRIGAIGGLLAIGVQELAEFSLQIPANAALFVTLCSVAVCSSSMAEAVRERNDRSLAFESGPATWGPLAPQPHGITVNAVSKSKGRSDRRASMSESPWA